MQKSGVLANRRILAVLIALFLFISTLPAKAEVFSDISDFTWAKDAIERFAAMDIVHGVGDGRFLPGDNVTRGQFAKILVRAFKLSQETQNQTFSDVPPDNMYYSYVESVQAYFPGYDGSAFLPDEPAQREDIVAAIVRVIGLQDEKLTNKSILKNTFSDAKDVSGDIYNLIGIAVENGIIKGFGDGTLQPKSPVRRAEVVVILDRVLPDDSHLSEPETPSATDLPLPSPSNQSGENTSPGEANNTGSVDMRIEVTSPNVAYSDDISVVGTVHTSNSDGLYVLVNGLKASTKKTSDGILFNIRVRNLQYGRNDFEIVAVNKKGQQVSQSFAVMYYSTPEITIENLPHETDQERIVIRVGVLDELQNIDCVFINDIPIDIPRGKKEIVLDREIQLEPGDNSIIVAARNVAGGECRKQAVVKYVVGKGSITIEGIEQYPDRVVIKGQYIGPSGVLIIRVGGVEAIVNRDNSFLAEVYNLPKGGNTISSVAYINGQKVAEIKEYVYIE